MGAPVTSILAGTAIGAGVFASGGTILPALAAAGMGMQAVGQLYEAQAAKQQADYMSKVATENARRSEDAANEALIRGQITEQQHRMRVSQAIGSARTAAAARGVLVDEGSALDLTSGMTAAGELDAQMIRRDTTMERRSAFDRADQFRSESQLETVRGRNVQTAGTIQAGSTVLTGASLVAEKWYTFGGAQ